MLISLISSEHVLTYENYTIVKAFELTHVAVRSKFLNISEQQLNNHVIICTQARDSRNLCSSLAMIEIHQLMRTQIVPSPGFSREGGLDVCMAGQRVIGQAASQINKFEEVAHSLSLRQIFEAMLAAAIFAFKSLSASCPNICTVHTQAHTHTYTHLRASVGPPH